MRGSLIAAVVVIGLALTSSAEGQTAPKKTACIPVNWIGELLPNSPRITFPTPGDTLFIDGQGGDGWKRRDAEITKELLTRPKMDENERRMLIERRDRIHASDRKFRLRMQQLLNETNSIHGDDPEFIERQNELRRRLSDNIKRGIRWVALGAKDLEGFKEAVRRTDETPESVDEEELVLDEGTAFRFLEEGSVETEILGRNAIDKSLQTTFWLKVQVLYGDRAGETLYQAAVSGPIRPLTTTENATRVLPADPALATVIDTRDRLPDAVRAGIVAMVKAAAKGGGR